MPPKMPKNTCPLLDDLIDKVKELASHCEMDYDYTWDLKEIISIIETVREANSDLRENAEYYMEEFERLENIESLYEDLKSDNEYLKDQLLTLEDELAACDDKLL